ncbi:SusC/RagA family TonB-linked outer membrane protein [Mucilaginibacter lappiensis]|uniref:TonB-linked SusC/RagA family outer membrane protein n=1 Tax=Mucilaginibacter lappiensis TaxID=354630 RepID=A0A841JR15_9SPHI|nr:SusC/RagA family TonB-linked outer membrane protein [Mucilaginibacter lappiensis]MBB6130735.1 TonB-linked SusC/RagA family outer membrane protein [Mucilaginibacter lappiensis]
MKKILLFTLIMPYLAMGANAHPKANVGAISNSRLTRSDSKQATKTIETIKGTVKDASGQPLIGVNVQVKGTTRGSQTDVNGTFTVQASVGETLVISYIGYAKKEIIISSAAALNIVLAEDSKTLGEVVVTALGIKRSANSLTYASQQINSESINLVKTNNLMNSLSGKVAGLTISSSASGIGGSVKVNLRGSRSANGSNQPLYVVDGIPILNSANANGQPGNTYGGSPDGGDGISNLNPEDIASVSVLEGASAAALYGSQAQNGVILITTKKGKAGKAQINFTSGVTVDHAVSLPKFQNQYGQTAGMTSGDITSWGAPITNTTDNLKAFFQNGVNLTNSINLSAGNEAAQTFISYANTHATGIEPNNKLNRNNFSLHETAGFLNNKLTVDGNINYINQTINNSPNLGFYSNPITSLYMFPRGVDIQPYKDQYLFPDKTGYARQNWITNGAGDLHQDSPWWIINREPGIAQRNRILLSGSVKYEFNKWLNVQVRGNADRVTDDFEKDFYSGSNNVYDNRGNGFLALSNQTVTQKYGDAIVNFTVPLPHSDFKINGLVGTSITDIQTKGISYGGPLSTPDFFSAGNIIAALAGSPGNTTLNAIGKGGYPNITTPTFAISPAHSQLQAIFGSADFSYKDWAYLTVTGRNDWSSNLSFTNNFSYFYPSVGGSVILSKALHLPEVITYAKLRGSYAQVGNTIPPYLTNIQNTQGGDGSLIFTTTAAPNTLKPEKTNSYEAGADLRFFDSKVNLSFTFFKTNTLNQYVPVIPSSTSLVSTRYTNAGNIQNKGFEFVLGYDVFSNPDLSWNTSFNGSVIKNTIIDVDDKDGINSFDLHAGDNGYALRLVKGGSYGDLYARTLARDAQGRVILSGTGTATDPYTPTKTNDYQYVGNTNPKFQLGWSNTFTYKRFTLNVLVDGKFGGQVMSMTQGFLDWAGVSEASGQARQQGGVKVNGVNSTGQAVSTVNAQAWYSYIGNRDGVLGEYIYSATVVRLREAALGYTLPITNSAFKSIKLSLTGRNLFYFYKKAPYDPELTMGTGNTFSGIDLFGQPAVRSMGFNLNVTF